MNEPVVATTRDATISLLQVAGINCNDLANLTIEQERVCVRNYINSKRAEKGVPALTLMNTLSWGAQQHSQDMRDANDLFHSTDLEEQMNERLGPGEGFLMGENIGVISPLTGTPFDGLMQAFWDSVPHRQNMLLGRYNRLGVGCVTDQPRNKWWVTCWFVDTTP